jgi:pilus assembly protein CpaB
MRRRILTVALALLLAGVGTAGVLDYVRQANARAIAGLKAVTVLVAKDKIPSGTPAGAALRRGLLVRQELPVQSVPGDAVGSITPSLSQLVTSTVMQPGQLLVRRMLVIAAQAAGGIGIPPGMLEVTVHLCVPEAVAGNLHAGSEVAVFDTVTSSAQSTANPACNGPHQQQTPAHTRVVLPRVLVLSVGAGSAAGGSTTSSGVFTSAGSGASSSQNGVLVTVAVSQADAEQLIQLTETGLPYLGLLTDSSNTARDTARAPRAGSGTRSR